MSGETTGLPPHGWAYKTVQSARLQNLMSQKPLDSIVEEILANAIVSRADPKKSCDERKRTYRVEFELTSRRHECANAMDQLLNGAFGLRARYAVDAHEGTNATRRVCRIIAEALRAGRLPYSDDFAHLEGDLVENLEPSLSLPSAKVWFGRSVDLAQASLEEGELECTVWIKSRFDDLAGISEVLSSDGFELTSQDFEYKICKGRTAPTTNSIDIKGAWVTENGGEYVALNKGKRALQIHLLGWS